MVQGFPWQLGLVLTLRISASRGLGWQARATVPGTSAAPSDPGDRARACVGVGAETEPRCAREEAGLSPALSEVGGLHRSFLGGLFRGQERGRLAKEWQGCSQAVAEVSAGHEREELWKCSKTQPRMRCWVPFSSHPLLLGSLETCLGIVASEVAARGILPLPAYPARAFWACATTTAGLWPAQATLAVGLAHAMVPGIQAEFPRSLRLAELASSSGGVR